MTSTKELSVRVLAQANILEKLGNYHCAAYMREASERLSELADVGSLCSLGQKTK